MAIERERHDRTNLESQMREKIRELVDLQQRYVSSVPISVAPHLTATSRSQDLTQQNEKLRLQLSEKDGTISTLTNAQRTHHQATVSLLGLLFFQNALRSAVFHQHGQEADEVIQL